jgi:hypothetical protein
MKFHSFKFVGNLPKLKIKARCDPDLMHTSLFPPQTWVNSTSFDNLMTAGYRPSGYGRCCYLVNLIRLHNESSWFFGEKIQYLI